MSSKNFDFDVLVIGAGPGGYVAAIRAAQLGLKTACIDKRSAPGGTCLNVGCIPSKSLLNASAYYQQVANGDLEKFGIHTQDVKLDLQGMMAEKKKTVDELSQGVTYLFKKNKVKHIVGQASFLSPNSVEVNEQTISAEHIIIATGSSPSVLPNFGTLSDTVVDSSGALSFSEVPDHLVVVGAGVIGLELGSVWARLGSKVTVIEYADSILTGMDKDICDTALKVFESQGLAIKLSCEVISIEQASQQQRGEKANIQTITLKSRESDKQETIAATHVLLATGRRPNTDNLGLQNIGVQTDQHGFIKVDDRFTTNCSSVKAIGDVTAGLMLAHRAEEEGIAVAETIAGKAGIVNYQVIPNVVYTQPEIASVGLNETQARQHGDIKTGMFPFAANSRAKTNRDTQGFVKVITSAEDDTVLGVHIIGSQAGNMIAQASQAMEFGATSEDIAYSCHAHPTHAEALKEAAMSVLGKAIHQ